MSKMSVQDILDILLVKQPWRSLADNMYLIGYHRNTDVPFCTDCGDWHYEDEMCSTFDGCYANE